MVYLFSYINNVININCIVSFEHYSFGSAYGSGSGSGARHVSSCRASDTYVLNLKSKSSPVKSPTCPRPSAYLLLS